MNTPMNDLLNALIRNEERHGAAEMTISEARSVLEWANLRGVPAGTDAFADFLRGHGFKVSQRAAGTQTRHIVSL